jgi:hypothetical protein
VKPQQLLIVSPPAAPRQHPSALPHKASPVATTPIQDLPQSFFSRPAEEVAPDLIGCLLVKRQPTGELLWGVIVETEAYSPEQKQTGFTRATAAAVFV